MRIAVLPMAAVGLLSAAAAVLVVTYSSLWTVITVLAGWIVGCVAILIVTLGRADAVVRALRREYDNAVPATPTEGSSRTAFGDAYGQQRRVFVNLAGRLQSLIQRAIVKVDELEHEVEDPDLLKGLFTVDHLATRVRRQAENLAVLGGDPPQRQSDNPVSMYAVLRSAVAEIEHYARVKVVHPVEGTLHGHAVAEFIHLLAELLENATSFSPPDAPVMLRAQNVTAGLAIEVQDRGLGMQAEDLERINRLLGDSSRLDLGELFEDGRIGLSVVRELAHRHGISVRLQTNIFGGIDAAVVIPHTLLGDTSDEAEPSHVSRPVQQEPQDNVDAVGSDVAAESAFPQSPASRRPQSQPEPDGPKVGQFPHAPHAPASSAQPSVAPAQPSAAPAAPAHPPAAPAHPPAAPASPVASSTHGATSAPAAGKDERPPLPKRHRTSPHMRPELRERTGTNPIPDHNPTLMAAFRKGLSHDSDEPGWPEDHTN
ncbi:sensor histidine kinase [Halopolyspora algeriensis]|uniref:sensor histidine kinase n=1 Tax=Halopolyspora algeriensis TaxID=1500506 RepID=UPI001FE39109|nr:ATP-binding protein [Halopolyspora algeriensis]